jgi:hypothetical protein
LLLQVAQVAAEKPLSAQVAAAVLAVCVRLQV